MKRTKGFTAVEIIFVLAIGAVILTMTFMAISSAQKNKRDTQRKNDLARLNQGIINWANEHAGANPTNSEMSAGGSFHSQYIVDRIKSPSTGTAYTIATGVLSDFVCTTYQDTIVYERINERSYNIKICLESGELSENH